MKRNSVFIFPTLGIVLLAVAGYVSAHDEAWIQPGLNVQILNVSIPGDRKPVVTFKMTNDKGQALDNSGVLTPGAVTTRFILAYIPANEAQYVNYVTRTVTSAVTGMTVNQPTTDSTGNYSSLGDGIYTYTFAATLASNYDRTATHTIGIQASRDLRQFGLSTYVANSLLNFVPDGRQVTTVREVVATSNCNQCHNPLAMHGGNRRETGLCILCHTPQNLDPNTGNALDFKVMVHKIHRGQNLPSVLAGTPYQIGAPANAVDFSGVTYPQDIRNCTKCHQNTSQANNWLLEPSRPACGSCHDDVNFKTGQNHVSGPADDNSCPKCHQQQGDREYDASISGAHTVPYRSTQLKNPKFEILSVTNTGPGQKPTVQLRITDKDNVAIAPSQMTRLSLRLAGPTTDYKWFLSETATSASYANGVAVYSFTGSLPSDATGTYSVGIEGYVNVTLNPGTTKELVYRDAGDNVLKFFAVTGTAVTPRRVVVDVAKCNKCHDKLLHHSSRNDPQYCVGCHNPTMTDAARRPADQQPSQSIHFKVLIHRIHTGTDLTDDFTIWGGSPSNFNNVTFPGDRRDCTTCHVGTSNTLPLASGLLASATPRWYWSPTEPISAACLGCHDSLDAAVHALINTASFGESCVVCHKEGAESAVSKVHAR